MTRLCTQRQAHTVLREMFGYESFRPGQVDAVEHASAGDDVVVVLPTGLGKSICYQVPAIAAGRRGLGVTIVVSPLIALMQDQVAQLIGRGVSAAALHSHLSSEESREVVDDLLGGTLTLLYVSPERAAKASFRRLLQRVDVALVAIDEAHCVSQWGHDFRPDYMRLHELREVCSAPIIALTATATPRVVHEIASKLELPQPVLVRGDFRRPNFRFGVRHARTAKQRLEILEAELVSLGLHTKKGSGRAVIYCSTRKTVESVAKALRAKKVSVGYYHAGRTPLARDRAQRSLSEGRTRVLVATNAFGMGIDMPDVRLIVHYQTPGSLESYYQEAGRAGRDGEPARCVLFFGAADMMTQRRLMGSSGGAAVLRHRVASLAAMEAYAHARECRQAMLCGHFDPDVEHRDCSNCDVCAPEGPGDAAPEGKAAVAPTQTLPEDALGVIVEAVDALRKPVGKSSLAKALRGSKARALTKLGLRDLPQHGALQEYDEKSVVAAIEGLLQNGCLARAGRKYPTVWLPGKPIRARPAAGAAGAAASRRPRGSLASELERYRKRMAGKLKWKAYMVFQRQAILAIAKAQPSTRDELLLIPGLGPAKVDRFGDDILELVRQHGP
ncbi:MAG: RecQ family ATP-dependent DNA helicase [Nannocystaceae bacterium]|nr:RecQ family ATP-dependent DNA helicase [Nannocystaceae bacterium]